MAARVKVRIAVAVDPKGAQADEIESLRSEVARLRAQVGWRPIETAPTNKAILIHVPHDDYYGNGGCYAAILVDMGTGRRWFTFGRHVGRDLGLGTDPTHWMPLPPPPDSDAVPTEEEAPDA